MKAVTKDGIMILFKKNATKNLNDIFSNGNNKDNTTFLIFAMVTATATIINVEPPKNTPNHKHKLH